MIPLGFNPKAFVPFLIYPIVCQPKFKSAKRVYMHRFIFLLTQFLGLGLMLTAISKPAISGPAETIDRPIQRYQEKPLSPQKHPQSPIALSKPAPPVLPALKPSSGPGFYLRKIHITGNTVLSDAELQAISRPYEGRNVNEDELRQLRQDLTAYYIGKGFINSGAVLPEQDIKNGELDIMIVEGRLTEIELEGLDHLKEFYIRSRLQGDEDAPLNVNDLQHRLQILQQNALIQKINADLSPGLKPGAARLHARLQENRPWYLTFGGDNNGVPSVGAERIAVWAGHRNLFGIGDAVNGNFNISEGQTQYAFDYALPFTPWDTRFITSYQHAQADVVEKPFDQLNIFNESDSIAIGVSQPVWQTLENSLTLGVTGEWRHSKAFLLNEAFSFSRGAINGVSNVSVLRFSQDWLNRTDTHVYAARSILNWGIDAFNATINPGSSELPDGRYFFWLGQAQWVQKLFDTGIEMHLQGNAQLAANPLLSLEQYALGGMYSVRGYRKNQLVRDNGFSSTLELRTPIPYLDDYLGKDVLRFAPFMDYGRAWYTEFTTPSPHVLASAGVGLHIDPVKELHMEFYWARPLRKIEYNGYDLQDSGIHFQMAYTPF